MKFFAPDWDDRVDPGYDFATDRFSLVRHPYESDVYAHELFRERVYDGVLVSRMALGESGPKRERVDRVGMRTYLRLPLDLELLGDCGAFGYVAEKEPRFETAEVIDYYHRLRFDYGVSVDHLIVTEFNDQRNYRYEVTLRNAEDFLSVYRRGQYQFTPIGAIQGWDVFSYVEAARSVVKMGYDYFAIGGLARSNTKTVGEIVSAVAQAVPPEVRIHIFGVARLTLLPLFQEFQITSVDSSAPLRQAWLSARDNYYTLDRTYAAIRIPIVDQERAKRQTIVGKSEADLATLVAAEKEALAAIRAYDRREVKLQSALTAILVYDELLAKRKFGHTSDRQRQLYLETLRDRPWKRCSCDVCRALGVEVIIFRGNNRNRRRGFHNMRVAWQRVHGHHDLTSSSGRPTWRACDVASRYPLPINFE